MRQHEMDELTDIYEQRGLPKDLAKEVALHLTKNDGGRPPVNCLALAYPAHWLTLVVRNSPDLLVKGRLL